MCYSASFWEVIAARWTRHRTIRLPGEALGICVLGRRASSLPFFRKLLPEVVLESRESTQIETYRGSVSWEASGQQKSQVMTVWPATDARPNECRIARINQFDFSGLVQKDPRGGPSILMLFQQKNGVVQAYFTTETSLRSENWHPTIKNFTEAWVGHGS